MRSVFISQSPAQTKKLGEFLAKEILKAPLRKRAFLIGLEGDLGGGKTTFLQGFAKGLRIKEKILSPTFVIMKKFIIPKKNIGDTYVNFYHIDCYRVEKSKEILNLGFKKIITSPKNIVAIEWIDRVKKILPKKSLILKFALANINQRRIIFKNGR